MVRSSLALALLAILVDSSIDLARSAEPAAVKKTADKKTADKKAEALKPPAYTNPENSDEDFPFQGEYAGKILYGESQTDVGVQLIAQGDGKFRGVFYLGGLPGDGWDKTPRLDAEGERHDDVVSFELALGSGRVRDGYVEFYAPGDVALGKISKVERKSPTLGRAPPAGAVVLFDGSSTDAFKNGRLSPEKLLIEGGDTVETFGDCTLHLEFRIPYMPTAVGQQRGNSGCYLQSRYEVQILDSFGLDGKNNECGGIYEIKDPDVNMCYPPLAWQTYDIDFVAARFDAAGEKTDDARLTVRHNGVVVQDDVEVPRTTRAAPLKESPEPGPLHLQNHGNPVRYRNIWIVRRQ